MPGSSAIRSAAMPAATSAVAPHGEPVKNLFDYIVILRIALHRLRRALHVHRTDTAAARDNQRAHRRIGQSGHVVDRLRAGIKASGGDDRDLMYQRKPGRAIAGIVP